METKEDPEHQIKLCQDNNRLQPSYLEDQDLHRKVWALQSQYSSETSLTELLTTWSVRSYNIAVLWSAGSEFKGLLVSCKVKLSEKRQLCPLVLIFMLTAFGFCEYSNPDSALRAIRLLHDLEIGEKKLVVKVDAKTKVVLDNYKGELNANWYF